MNIGIHPAPGFGELLPGFFVVPHNPIVQASYVPRIGELLPAKFSMPENPIIRALAGDNGLRPTGPRQVSVSALGQCGCIAGKCGMGCEQLGMSGLGMGDLGTMIASTWPWLAIGVLLLFVGGRPSGSEYRAARMKARAKYLTELAELRRKYRTYRRVGRAVGGRVRAGLEAAASKLPEPAG